MTWLIDLFEVLISKLPNRHSEVSPLLAQVVQHTKGVQAILADRAVTNMANSILLHRDAAISTIAGPIPKELINKLRSSPLLKDILFDLSLEDFERRHDRLMF